MSCCTAQCTCIGRECRRADAAALVRRTFRALSARRRAAKNCSTQCTQSTRWHPLWRLEAAAMRCDAEAEATAAVPRRAARLPRVDCNAARLVRLPRRDERQHSSASVGSPLLFSPLLHVSSRLFSFTSPSRLVSSPSLLVSSRRHLMCAVRLRSRAERSGAALPPPLSLSLSALLVRRRGTRDTARREATRRDTAKEKEKAERKRTERSGAEWNGTQRREGYNATQRELFGEEQSAAASLLYSLYNYSNCNVLYSLLIPALQGSGNRAYFIQ